MSLNTKQLTAAFISKLQSDITEVKDFAAYPKDIEKYVNICPDKVVLVKYAGSKFSKPEKGNKYYQNRNFLFQVYVLEKNFNAETEDETELYEIVDKILDSLTGIKIQGFKEMYPTDDQFLEELDKIWMHGINFTIERLRK